MDDLLRDRLDDLMQARRQHVTDNAHPKVDEWDEYKSTDGEASFKHEDDYSYYERLTGHIEEVQYLISEVAQTI